MANTDFDTLNGKLQISERPASLCYGKPWDFVRLLTRILTIQFPVNPGNEFIVSGHTTPKVDDQHRLWARFSANRNPLGWFAFVKGKWRKFYTTAPGEIRWFIGDSTSPPDGWQALDSNVAGIPTEVLDRLMEQYVEKDSAPGEFLYYAARYIGY